MAAAGSKKPVKGGNESERQIVCSNRRARHDYDVLDEIDCGIVLSGSEVKSVRNHKITIEEAHARVEGREVWLVDCDIAEYAEASIYNHARQRKRKLLLHRREIRKFAEAGENDGLTLIPLAVFFQRGFIKLRLGLCKGRKQHDKRQRLKEADDRREMRSARMKFTGGPRRR
ncbi:MAG: SsrA-binding protein [Planctomycetota bacterium]|jgi:SsrA-binding protein